MLRRKEDETRGIYKKKLDRVFGTRRNEKQVVIFAEKAFVNKY